MKSYVLRSILFALLGVLAVSAVPAKNLHALSQLNGHQIRSVELGLPFAGALAQDPANDNRIYVSVGYFGSQSLLAVNLDTGTTATVANGFGNIGGLAVLANGDLAITESFLLSTTLRARDTNGDGDYLDTGEVSELIAPILVDVYFTGAQLAVAPAGNASAIPAGSLLLQTADGQTSSELLVIQDPTTSPSAYRPAGGAYFSGFQYNGGIAFDASGNVIMGAAQWMTGCIYALVNSNANSTIDAGEAHVIVEPAALGLGIADLTVSKENVAFYGQNGGAIKSFTLPADLANGTATPTAFLETDAIYLSTVRISHPGREFRAGASSNTAKLYVGGYVAPFEQTTNLLVIEPGPMAAVSEWTLYE